MPQVLTTFNPVVQPVENAPLNRPIKFLQLPLCNIADSNCPVQALSSTASAI
jgi:hypothetical protein